VVKTLTVTVENRDPEVKATATAPTLATLTAAGPHTPVAPAKPLKNENDDNTLNLYSVSLPVGGQFTDPDAADAGKLTYTITSGRQDVVVQDGGTCKTASCKVWVDIVTRRISADEFDLNVVATDAAKATSAAVMFPIRMEPPAEQTYNVEQFKVTYNFRPIAVGYRAVTEHTLVFKHPDDDPEGTRVMGFVFADALIAKLTEIQSLAVTPADPAAPNAMPDSPSGFPVPGVANPPDALYGVSTPTALADDASANGSLSTFTVNTTGRVSVAAVRAGTASTEALAVSASADPVLAFTVSGVGTGTIEIGYHVWWDEDGEGGSKLAKWHSAKETLAVTVEAVD
jgi:hypothetical protein